MTYRDKHSGVTVTEVNTNLTRAGFEEVTRYQIPFGSLMVIRANPKDGRFAISYEGMLAPDLIFKDGKDIIRWLKSHQLAFI